MLSKEANERLCRVEPGTPMGTLMRRYWQPIAPTDRLLENPVRKVRILGETLVLYRDRGGRLGLIQDKCAHRSMGMIWAFRRRKGCAVPITVGCTTLTAAAWKRRSSPARARSRTAFKSRAIPWRSWAD